MYARRLYNDLHRAGLALRTDGEKLIVSCADLLTNQQRADLRAHKAELIGLLLIAGCTTAAQLMDLAMLRCTQLGDGDQAREQMRQDVLATPAHLCQDLLAYFTQVTKGAKP